MSSYGTSGTKLRDHAVPLVAPRSGTRGPYRAPSRPAASACRSPVESRKAKVVPVVSRRQDRAMEGVEQ